MKNDQFTAIVKQASVISDEKRAELLENSEWLTDDERAQLVNTFTNAELDIKDIEQGNGERLKAFNEALGEFQKKELPKLVKEKEHQERKSEAKEDPEGLLEGWEDNSKKD